MTKREAKIEALGYIISIADVSMDDDMSINELPEKQRDKVCGAVNDILDAMRDRLAKLEG